MINDFLRKIIYLAFSFCTARLLDVMFMFGLYDSRLI